MALKDLLVHVDNSKACGARLDAAVHVAQSHGAHLTGVHIVPRLYIPGYAEMQVPLEVIEAQREALEARLAEAETAFRTVTDKAGLSAEWRSAEGNLAGTLALHGRYVDALIVGQPDKNDPVSTSEGLAGKLVLDVGRPILVIPYIGASPSFGQRILIAWNATRQAVRAVHDALPLLERANSVVVLSVNPPAGKGGDGDIPSADICLHLSRHGINAEADHVEAHDIDVGNMLLSRAFDMGVDLIVMGAYGHSRLRELVLGGATRHLIEHMTVPVLMSH